jgi:hypothetical protein
MELGGFEPLTSGVRSFLAGSLKLVIVRASMIQAPLASRFRAVPRYEKGFLPCLAASFLLCLELRAHCFC